MIPWYRLDLWLCWWLTSRTDMDSRWVREAIVWAYERQEALTREADIETGVFL